MPTSLGAILGRPGGVSGRLGVILGPSWGHLGPSWAVLGPSWDHVGAILASRWLTFDFDFASIRNGRESRSAIGNMLKILLKRCQEYLQHHAEGPGLIAKSMSTVNSWRKPRAHRKEHVLSERSPSNQSFVFRHYVVPILLPI